MRLSETCQAAVDECLTLADRVKSLGEELPGYFGTAQGGSGSDSGHEYESMAALLFRIRRSLAQIEQLVDPIEYVE